MSNLFFLDAFHGWAVGLGGLIVRTTNGGLTWQADSVQASLYSVGFASQTHGFIGGYEGIVMETFDGGVTWNERSEFSETSIYDIDFINEYRGWISGYGSWDYAARLYDTENGGVDWSLTQPECDFGCYGMDFLNSEIGCAVGTGEMILTTMNGGNSWTEHTSQDDRWLKGVDLCGNGVGCAVGSSGRIARTEDNWDTITELCPLHDDQLLDVGFADTEHGWAVGYNGTYGSLIMQTDDGGQSWERTDFDGYEALYSISVVNSQVIWMVGSFGLILRSMDGGQEWDTLTAYSQDDYEDSFFFDELSGWIVGRNVIVNTDDGGNTWNRTVSYDFLNLVAVDFVNENTGWFINEDGDVFRTTDGGENWLSSSVDFQWIRTIDVEFIDEQRGWIIGYDYYTGDAAVLFSSVDGGVTWTEQLRSSELSFSSIEFNESQQGIITGSDGFLISADGGETWTVEASIAYDYVHAAAFAGNEVWAVGQNGTILHKDGIVHAPPSQSPLVPALFSIRAFPNPFNPETTIRLNLDQPQRIELSVFDITGRLVERIAEGGFPAGLYSYSFNAASLPSGTYFARLQGTTNTAVTKLIVLK